MNVEALLRDCDCAIVTAPASLYYLSGFDCADAIIVLTDKERVYLTNSLYEIAVKSVIGRDWSVKVLSRSEQLAYVRSAIRSARRVGIEFDDMTLTRYHALFGAEPRDTVNLSPVIASMRLVKSEEELAIITSAEHVVDRTFSEIKSLLSVGVTEREIAAEIMLRMMRYGAEGTAFDTIVAFGENAAKPHAVPSDRTLKKGDCVLMDFGAKYKGYCSDFTRTVFCGEPTEDFRKAYDLVLRAQRAAIDYLEQGGRIAKEADLAARRVIDDSPYKGSFNHTLGHGVGIEIHEAPTLSSMSKDMLSDGMVFTLEPGIYVEGSFGVRIESLVTIQNGKLTVIDRSDKEIYTF